MASLHSESCLCFFFPRGETNERMCICVCVCPFFFFIQTLYYVPLRGGDQSRWRGLVLPSSPLKGFLLVCVQWGEKGE